MDLTFWRKEQIKVMLGEVNRILGGIPLTGYLDKKYLLAVTLGDYIT